MSAAPIRITGQVIGCHMKAGGAENCGQIVYVRREHQPLGPAENAFIYIECQSGKPLRARYISWINLNDIDHAMQQRPREWRLISPEQVFDAKVKWCPFGWGGEPLPNVAYVLPR